MGSRQRELQEAFERRLDQQEADARRYRWLRSRDPGPAEAAVPPGLFIGQVPQNMILTGEDADAAIDAAMTAEEQASG